MAASPQDMMRAVRGHGIEGSKRVKRLLNVSQLSQLLSIAPSTIYQWVQEGKIPHYRLGRLVRFSETEIEGWLHQRLARPDARCTIDIISDPAFSERTAKKNS